MHSSLKTLVILVFVLSVSACGFQLRGSNIDASISSISPLYIAGLSQTDDLYRTIRDYMRSSDVRLTTDRASATEILTIYERQKEKKVHSVGSTGKVLEYELLDGFSYFLGPPPKRLAIENPNKVSGRRIYTNPETEVLGRKNEENQIWQDLHRQLAERLIRQLAKQVN